MGEKKKADLKTVELFTIEELAQKNNISNWVIAGVKQRHNWGIGKKISEDEFAKKIKDFLKGEMKKK